MRIVTWNIQFGLGRDGRIDLARIADTVRDADIICLQEIDRHWRRSGMVDQVADLMRLLPDRYAVFGAGLDVDASERRGQNVINRRRQFGNMTLSRWPILSSRAIVLPKIDTGAEFNTWCPALEAVIGAPGERPVRVLNTHLSHARTDERLLQIRSLRRIICEAAAEGGAWGGEDADCDLWQCDDPAPPMPASVIVAGDLNAEPQSEELRLLTGDGADGFGLVDGWQRAAPAGDGGITFFRDDHQGADHDMRIDYVLLSPDLAALLTDVRIDGVTPASDHQPVWATLPLPTGQG